MAATRTRWLESLIGTPQLVLAERDGTGHAGNFARMVLPQATRPGSIVERTPTTLDEGLLA